LELFGGCTLITADAGTELLPMVREAVPLLRVAAVTVPTVST
jgi:hypothetical protein